MGGPDCGEDHGLSYRVSWCAHDEVLGVSLRRLTTHMTRQGIKVRSAQELITAVGGYTAAEEEAVKSITNKRIKSVEAEGSGNDEALRHHAKRVKTDKKKDKKKDKKDK